MHHFQALITLTALDSDRLSLMTKIKCLIFRVTFLKFFVSQFFFISYEQKTFILAVHFDVISV